MQANSVAGEFTIIDSNLGILALKVPQDEAIRVVYAVVDDEPTLDEVLDFLETPPDPAAWRTEWAEATAVELSRIDAKADDAKTVKEIRQIRDELDSMRSDQVAVVRNLNAEALSRKRADVKRKLNDEHTRLVQVLASDNGLDYQDALTSYSLAVWRHLKTTPLYHEYYRLNAEVEGK